MAEKIEGNPEDFTEHQDAAEIDNTEYGPGAELAPDESSVEVDPEPPLPQIEDQNTQGDNKYEERSRLLLGDLDRKLDAEKIPTACIIIIDPKCDKPIVYVRGHKYNTAVAACELARITKEQILEELRV